MIKLELSESDLNKLVKAGRELSGNVMLDKLNNFRLLDGNCLAFDQTIILSTTPSVRLSTDNSGRLLIDIIRLADNLIGGGVLWAAEGFVTGKIADKSKGLLHKETSSQLSLDLTKVLPVKAQIKKVTIQHQTLYLEISID